MSSEKELKRKWLRAHGGVIGSVIIFLMTVFICAIIFHSIGLIMVGIISGFISYFYGRHKLLSYIESELYK